MQTSVCVLFADVIIGVSVAIPLFILLTCVVLIVVILVVYTVRRRRYHHYILHSVAMEKPDDNPSLNTSS